MVVFVSLLFMSASIPADMIYVEDVLGVEDLGLGVVFTGSTLGMLAGANVVARRVSLGALATAVFVGVTIQASGSSSRRSGSSSAFMVAMYSVGASATASRASTSRSLIHRPDRPGAARARMPAWNGIRNGAELGALAVGGLVVGASARARRSGSRRAVGAQGGVVGLATLAWRRGGAREFEVGARGYDRLPVSVDAAVPVLAAVRSMLPQHGSPRS